MKTFNVNSVEDIKVDGFNLVVQQPDGTSQVLENAVIEIAKG